MQHEWRLQSAAHVYLCRALPQAVHWGTDHAAKRSPIAGARLKARGIVAGIPDHFTYYKGILIAWELKVGRNTTSASQDAFGARLFNNDGHYYVVRSVQDIEDALLSFGWKLEASAAGIDARLAVPRAPSKRKPTEKPTRAQVRRVQSVLEKYLPKG